MTEAEYEKEIYAIVTMGHGHSGVHCRVCKEETKDIIALHKKYMDELPRARRVRGRG